ncbi:MAG: formimidoylglutamate deiminase [Actinomycetota bacterium]|nr:formimidoylglutamate deiminase [Actinomycetota bacterium]
MTTYLLEHALLPEGIADNVLVRIENGRFSDVRSGAEEPAGKTRSPLRGLSLPGLANCHSHAFHRALRGRTQAERGTFWTWRSQMYDVAARLTPDSYYALARATYAEMVASGITAVGEFHYLHHQPDGTPYDDPNAMGQALLEAARDVKIRISLLDTCYLSSGFGAEPVGAQVRYSDGSAERWAERVGSLPASSGVVIGAAVHSVRAVPRSQIPVVAAWAAGAPLHLHLGEQVAENEQCQAAYGLTPAQVFDEAGALGPLTSAVHATHLTDADIALLGGRKTRACFCPTTERDLGDGIGPSRRLHAAGSPLTLGSDSHAVIDLFEEMRAVELDERLDSQSRGHWSAAELTASATENGHASLGFPDAGSIRVGARADLVTLDLESLRTAGTGTSLESVVFAASAADVTNVVVDGEVVFDGDRVEIGRDLADTIALVWKGMR